MSKLKPFELMSFMEYKSIKNLILGFLGIAILLCLSIAKRRADFEKMNHKVEIATNYKDLEKLALLSGKPIDTVLADFKEKAHTNSIVLEEQTLEDYINNGLVTVLKGSDIKNLYRQVGRLNQDILYYLYSKGRKKIKGVKADHFYILTNEYEVFDNIKTHLTKELGKANVKKIGSRNYLENLLDVRDEEDDLYAIGLGLSDTALKRLSKHDFTIIPSILSSSRSSSASIKQKFSTIATQSQVKTIMFQDPIILGYPNKLELIEDLILNHNLNFASIEFQHQEGLNYISKNIPQKHLNMHTITPEESEKLSETRMVRRFIRSVKERSAKIIYVRPVFNVQKGDYLLQHNLRYFKQIHDGLASFNFQTKPISSLALNEYMPAKSWELFVISLATILIALILLNYFLPVGLIQLISSLIIFLGLYSLSTLTGNISLLHQILAILVAVTFPTLALISQFPHTVPKGLAKIPFAIYFTAKLTLFCLAGALFIIAFLSDIHYLLGIQQFFGVKISFILPLLLIGTFFFLRPQRIKSFFYIFQRLFFSPIRTGVLLAVFLCLMFIFVYILRSGNYISFSIPIFEIQLREWLESLFFVRPRTKEFLIGYPVLLCTILFIDKGISRQWLWFFNLLGVVALISVVNSFCHIHTPLTISLTRTLLGLIIGLLFGLITAIFYKSIRYFIKS